MGYLLPWGQMSYWGAQVIINLFTTIPFIGPELGVWIRGDFAISDPTLTRFFALHIVAVPMVILLLVILHLAALHTVGSNNPDGVEIKKHKDENGIPIRWSSIPSLLYCQRFRGNRGFPLPIFINCIFYARNGRIFFRTRKLYPSKSFGYT